MQKTGASSPRVSMPQNLVFFAAVFGPFSTVPQIVEIWTEKSAAGVSFMSWSAFFLMSAIWLFYGISRHDRPLILSNSLWLVGEAIVMTGAILYDVDFL